MPLVSHPAAWFNVAAFFYLGYAFLGAGNDVLERFDLMGSLARVSERARRWFSPLEGVAAILTGADLHDIDPYYGHAIKDRPIVALDRVRFAGEPVAAVAALDEATAEAAVRAIEVEYEELPAVFDPLAAVQPDAPVLHEDGDSYALFGAGSRAARGDARRRGLVLGRLRGVPPRQAADPGGRFQHRAAVVGAPSAPGRRPGAGGRPHARGPAAVVVAPRAVARLSADLLTR